MRHPLRSDRGGGLPPDSAGQAGRDHSRLRNPDERRGGRAGPGPGELTPPRKKILSVGDAGPAAVLCVNVLQGLGYAVKGANRAEAAGELMGKAPFEPRGPDYNMRGRTGFDVFAQAR